MSDERPLLLARCCSCPATARRSSRSAASSGRADPRPRGLGRPGPQGRARELSRRVPRRPASSAAHLWVRVNAVADPSSRRVAASCPHAPTGSCCRSRAPRTTSSRSPQASTPSSRAGRTRGATKILPIATETPRGVFALGDYARCGPRLAALTWGAEDLARGARCRDERRRARRVAAAVSARALVVPARGRRGRRSGDRHRLYGLPRRTASRGKPRRRGATASRQARDPSRPGRDLQSHVPPADEIAAARRRRGVRGRSPAPASWRATARWSTGRISAARARSSPPRSSAGRGGPI